ncbi:MAG: PfkB family carbohydrate kinase [Velocimicrobium sp.]
MTERETQIFKWIKENPMISQQEIADRANITRSSAAVHISNLMKKGMIRGKGYVLQEENYSTVVGAVNVDISGTPNQKLVNADSNPGKMTISFGGVGRNIAENISRLGGQVEMITVLGDDFYAAEIEKSCRTLGIQLQHTLRVACENTSTYLCINDNKGDMEVAINDMSIYEKLTPEYLEDKMAIINKGRQVIIDANIPEETIKYLADKATVPILAEPVSTKKAMKFASVLDKIFLLKPNQLELELLSGITIENEKELQRAMDVLLDRGVKHLMVSMGSQGVYYGSIKGKMHYPCLPCQVVNTTGCGDALMGAMAWGMQNEESVSQAITYGLAAASICIEHQGAISQELTAKNLLKRLN